MFSSRAKKKRNGTNNSQIVHATIPPSINEIETAAYASCTRLQSISFPPTMSSNASDTDIGSSYSTITKIGRYAFRCCTSLSSIDIPSTVTCIDYGAFMGCTSLTSITIPESVQEIHKFAFSHCTSLVSVTLPTGTTGSTTKAKSKSNNERERDATLLQIHPAAFSNCKSLLSIYISKKNTTFVMPPEGYNARNPPPFGQCTKLERIFMLQKHACSGPGSSGGGSGGDIRAEMNTWLENRFDRLPLHQLCYDPNVTLEQLEEFLLTNNYHHSRNNNSRDNDTDATSSQKESLDSIGMTALHVLACNPYVKPEMIVLLLKYFPASLSMEATLYKMTPFQLYLSCHGLILPSSSSSTLSSSSTTKMNMLHHDHTQRYNSNSNNNSNNNNDNKKNNNNIDIRNQNENNNKKIPLIPLSVALQKGMDWEIIENIIAFQSSTSEQGFQDETSGLYPFMKAATLPQCSLKVVHNLALYFIDNLYTSNPNPIAKK